jgi:hypothetical protein
MPPAVATTYLLRMEAVNLAHFVYDTEDLSTMRGGGLLLLNAPTRLEKATEVWQEAGASEVKNITSGASQAIFQFTATDAGKVRDCVARWLRNEQGLKHATFVVDVVAKSAFASNREKLLALNRWRQMQQLRLAVPAWHDEQTPANDWPYCGIDFVRPAVKRNHTRNDDKRKVSDSVHARVEYGRRAKQQFYRDFAQWTPPVYPGVTKVDFAWDFHQIAARGAHRFGADAGETDSLATLNGKMAVIYIDGNQFSAVQGAHCTNKDRQKAWDNLLQERLRKPALRTLLDRAGKDDAWVCVPEPDKKSEVVLRLETLLWGGDELVWVVPAWKGWETLRLFFDTIHEHYRTAARPAAPPLPTHKNMGKVPTLGAPRQKTAPQEPGGFPRLTHCAGIVFCHADAPIHRIRKLAEKLANDAKAATGRKEDAFAYAVLESFDQLGSDFEDARAGHLPAGCSATDLVLRADDLKAKTSLTADLQTMRGRFPRGSVYRLLRELRGERKGNSRGFTEQSEKRFQSLLSRAERDAGESPARFRTTKEAKDRIAWLHLAELWDYLPLEGA